MALLWRDQSANRSSVAPFFQLAEEKEREKKKATERKNQISHWCDMFRQRRKELGKGERSILAILQRIWEEDRGKRGEEKEEEEMPREKLYLCAAIHTDRWPCAHIDMMLGSLSLSVTKEHIGASSKEHALGIKEHWRKPASQPASPSCCCSSSSIRRAVAASVYITSRPTYKWSSSRGKGNASAAEKKWLLMTDHK